MSILEQIPRTAAWTLKRIDLRAEARVRKELRALCAVLDGTFAAMWINTPAVEVVAFAGEPTLAPHEYPFVTSAMPSFETVVNTGGADQLALVQPVVLGRGMPRAAMLVVVGEVQGAEVFDIVIRAGEKIEDIVIDAIG